MPNIKSSAKRDLISKERNLRNKAIKTLLRTNLKKFDSAVISDDVEAAEAAHKAAVKSVDHAAAKGLIHKNNAAHKKSKMAMRMNAINQ